MVSYLEKPVGQVLEELGKSGAAFKFSACGGQLNISVDGFMDSLCEARAFQRALRKARAKGCEEEGEGLGVGNGESAFVV